ncbi:ribosomal biogenesis factor-like [Dromiciops gliroides]|uniref:ribosomal biogenesis factor-like n=1 Tax=Dromiciops gliroides TaxID=33562 RepID=UPI001CC74609|nr:ribosomal biogenesis factor-like [Dromiciops gliroides]
MGKNKGKGHKIRNVFHITSKNLKAKNKAKLVTTNLKKLISQCSEGETISVDDATRLMFQL